MLAFGPDSYLYISTGDGGSGGDPQGNAQNLGSLLGKILRIDVNSGNPYGIPPDNPFAGAPGRRGEIWAYGLRNPWRFSFDRLTGRLFVGDVGQNSFEEIDIIVRGGNYGWNVMEGLHCFSPPSGCDTSGLFPPIHEYGRDLGSAVTGGYVYRGGSIPSLTGKYLYADTYSGRIWSLTGLPTLAWQSEELLMTNATPVSFGEDESGELFVVDYNGSLRRIMISDAPQISVNAGGVVNAASFLPGPVAPGEIVTIFGSGIGPVQKVDARLNSSGLVDTAIGDTKVFFDGVAAPLFYVQSNQINAQVPYEVAGKASAVLQVQYQNALTPPVELPVADSFPAIFAISGGVGAGAILNQDSTLNSASNPATPGSVVVLYATGEGQTIPAGITGKLSEPPYPTPVAQVSVTIGGLPAEVIFAGGAPGFAGLLQVNVRVPSAVEPGNNVPIFLLTPFDRFFSRSSQPGVTLAVR